MSNSLLFNADLWKFFDMNNLLPMIKLDVDGGWYATLENRKSHTSCSYKEGNVLVGYVGRGKTPSEAFESFIYTYSGKMMYFENWERLPNKEPKYSPIYIQFPLIINIASNV